MEKILDKKIRRYVIATVDSPTVYLNASLLSRGGGYTFFKDMDRTTKFQNKSDAEWLLKLYRQETGDDVEMVVVPVDISYELLFEEL